MERFYFPGPAAEVRVVVHDSGHIAIVGREPRQLPPIMHASALAAGCLREGTAPAEPVVPSFAADPAKPLRDVLMAIADAAEPGTVDGEGRPTPDAARAALGIYVSDAAVFAEWANIEQGLIEEEAPTMPPIALLTDDQINLISELSQASFRSLQERIVSVSDVVVLEQVEAAEKRRAEPRATVLKLLEKQQAALKAAG